MKRVIFLLVNALLISSAVCFAQDPQYYTVYWSVNGDVISNQSEEAGSFIDMTPEAPMPSACMGNGYTYVGWTDTPISGSQGWEPSPLYTNVSDFPSVTQDITYYAVFRSDATAGGGTYEMTDVLTREMTGVASGSTTYVEWTGIMASSSAMYAGNTAGDNDAIQMRSNSNNTGIITTASGGTVTMVSVDWSDKTTDGRTLNVYGSSTPFTSVSDLYSGTGTLIGTLVKGTNTELSVSGYEYIGVRSASGALYLNSISITWNTPGAGGTMEYVTSCSSTPAGGDAMSGTLTSGQSWSLDDGRLSITGGGNIAGFEDPEGVPWYNRRNEITYLFLGADFFSIGAYVFYDLDNLTTISCPSSYLPTIVANTFNPNKISQITATVRADLLSQYQADPYWSQMTLDTYPDSGGDKPTIIAEGYFGDGDALHWALYSDGKMIIEGTGESIPEYTTGANDQPWYDYRETITELIINSNSSIIGNNAFAGLYKLQSVTFPEDMYLLGDYSFSGCYELSSITVRGTINVMSATTETFDGISDLTAINLYVPASMYSQYRASEFWSRMRVMPTDASGTVNVNTSWTLHNGVLSFSGDAMESIPYFSSMDGQPWGEYRESILAVDMSAAPLMNEIGGYAFAGCTALTQVIMPQSLTYVGGYAFLYCNSLSRIDMLTLEQVGVAEDAFDGLQTESIKLVVADSMVAVYQSASVWGNMNVTPLSEVSSGGDDQPQVIARGYLGDGDALAWRFYDNGQLTFDGEGAIPDFPDISYQPWSEYRSQITEVIMNADIPSVGSYAFSACDNLTTVTLSSSTTQLGDYTFSECDALTLITIPAEEVISASELVFGSYIDREQIKIAVPASQVQSYQGAMFWYEYNIIAISVSDGGLIENELYWGFNDSVLTIYGTGAMPDWIQSMAPWGDYVDQVKTVFVNSGVTYVCNGAFYGCENLTEVTFAETVDTVGSQIFSSNNYPISLYPQRMMPPGIAEDAFANVNGCVYVYCYESAYSEYESHPVWGTTCMGFVDDPAPELEPYQLEYIFVNMIGIRGYDPNIYTYDVTIPIDSGVPSVQFSRGNYDQDITCEQATSLPGTAYIHIAINGTRMATYTINFLVEGGADPQGETVVIALDSSWRFIMLPSAIDSMVTASDITIDGEVEWATYNGYKRAAGQSGWETENFASSYNLERGHIVRAVHDSATIIIKLPANLNQQSASLNLALYPSTHAENANWNLLGNPYSAGYRIAGLEAVGIESPITVWNGVGYTTYTPGIDDYVLQPFEAFFIQHTEDGAARLNLFPTYVEQ